MLILTRTEGEVLRIGDDITIQVITTQGGGVRLGITAPDDVRVLRSELVDRRIETGSEPAETPAARSDAERPRLRLRRRPRKVEPTGV